MPFFYLCMNKKLILQTNNARCALAYWGGQKKELYYCSVRIVQLSLENGISPGTGGGCEFCGIAYATLYKKYIFAEVCVHHHLFYVYQLLIMVRCIIGNWCNWISLDRQAWRTLRERTSVYAVCSIQHPLEISSS